MKEIKVKQERSRPSNSDKLGCVPALRTSEARMKTQCLDSAQMRSRLSAASENVARFAACVFRPRDIVEVRRLPSGLSTWHQADELVDVAASLVRDNKQGQHIYVGANPRRRRGGTTSRDVAFARCLFVDFDGITPEQAEKQWSDIGLPMPTLTLVSGHGVHAYWRLNEPLLDMAFWTKLQKRLIALLGSDRAIHDPARIMRLPGFWNHKQPAALSRILESDADRRYDLGCLIGAIYSVVTERDYAAQYQKALRQAILQRPPHESSEASIAIARKVSAKWPAADKGERNCRAFQNAAYLLKNLGLDQQQAWPVLLEWNEKNKPPLPEGELRQTLRNASFYGRHGSARNTCMS